MGGGLIQLVAYGDQDIYLTSDPQITYFKSVYRRYTNFAMESIAQTFNEQPDFGKRVTCTISRKGDLMHSVCLEVTLPQITPLGGGAFNWVNNIGHYLIKEVSIEVGGIVIDKQYGEWLTIWNELTQTSEKQDGYYEMIGNTASLTSNNVGDILYDNNDSGNLPQSQNNGDIVPETTLYVPLQFWFCRNRGLALPLISLQYHEVKLNLTFRNFDETYIITPATLTNANPSGTTTLSPVKPMIVDALLYVDYIFLDIDERQEFASSEHMYLIEQLQHNGNETAISNNSNKIKLGFNHPCKEIIWTLHSDEEYLFSESLVSAKLLLNGMERFAERKGNYFRLWQPYKHHTCIPKEPIYVYSFSLNAEEHQPSGTLNMSRIDNAELVLKTGDNVKIAKVYAVNYNVLRIIDGMGGLAYSN